MTAAPIPSRTGLALPMVLAVWLFLFSAQEAGAEKIARSASLVCSVEPRAMFPLGASGMSAIGSVVPHRLTLLTLHHATGPIDRYDPASLSLVGRAAGFPEMQFDNPPTFGSIDRCGALEAPMTSAPLMYDWAPLLSVSQTLFATKPGGKTEIWRAVEPDELADLIGSGKYRPGPGNEGKYFFPTKAQAKNLADNILPGRKFCITSGCIDSSVLAKIDKIYPAGEGQAWFIPNELLPYIDNIVVHGPA
jgi:hypothetical protein